MYKLYVFFMYSNNDEFYTFSNRIEEVPKYIKLLLTSSWRLLFIGLYLYKRHTSTILFRSEKRVIHIIIIKCKVYTLK